MVDALLAWLTDLPAVALYAVLFVAAGLENVFPPLPADTVVAFGAFLAARGEASLVGAFLATWIGNVGGAIGMYVLGRRMGASALEARLPQFADAAAQRRILKLYERWGIPSLFLTRFLPGARALVPPLAGALRIPPLGTTVAIATASGIWYGVIAFLAYRVGSRWDELVARIGSMSRMAAIVAGVTVVLLAIVVYVRRRREAAPSTEG